ncbi:hypothetical protein BDP81DRAFT_159104 [Colletotrichum phormii]|uniref:Uncharacterized protein n=1 Tax=Colletotrichum phormii TaxID=359342 RepID=A0AAJ0A112_9PEZI|nr:uncharacterized protein BDP81DRAFT_159104 [Colletotrichum phormii]KAK1640157.1 hypothetical protein BDP81DRAFT_159104 [Colletotrichum phormii]
MDQSSQVAPSGRADSPSTLSDAQQPTPYQPMGEHEVLPHLIAIKVEPRTNSASPRKRSPMPAAPDRADGDGPSRR